ncbi:MAG: IS4 family transposase [Desulfuromusa sp.]|jgi:hypothetical protein|nr:IS4 family transposase [Desulfuromusa sp.]
MKNTTPMFPGFHLQTLRRKPQSAQQKLAKEMAQLKQKSFKQIGEFFENFIPRSLLKPEQAGKMSRRRLFSKENTFWAFFSQILDADGGCKEVIRKLQAYASIKGVQIPSSSTASYCTARKKLDEEMLSDILDHTARQLEKMPETGLLNNRRVIVVDGTGVSMPDTLMNQKTWPQSSMLKAGCSFPVAHICACFSLQTGGLLSYKIGNKKSSELTMFRKQWQTFNEGDIFLGDKGFCSYFDIAELKKRKVDSVVTLARRAPVTARSCKKKLGSNDLLISWERPKYTKKLAYSREQWEELPKELTLRQIRVEIKYPGFRKQSFYLVTTLLDATQYPAEELAELYFKRWDVELSFRDLKTTMGMDVLRCQSPELLPVSFHPAVNSWPLTLIIINSINVSAAHYRKSHCMIFLALPNSNSSFYDLDKTPEAVYQTIYLQCHDGSQLQVNIQCRGGGNLKCRLTIRWIFLAMQPKS